MDFIAKQTDISKQKTQCAVVFAFDNDLLASAKNIDASLGGGLSKTLKSKDLEVKAGQSVWITVPTTSKNQPYERVLLVQLGKREKSKANKLSSKDWAKICQALLTKICQSSAKEACVYVDDIALEHEENSSQLAKLLSVTAEKVVYRYNTTKKSTKLPTLKKIALITEDTRTAKQGLAAGSATGIGINTARELGNLPGNICTPSYLAKKAESMAADCEQLKTKIIGEKQMEKLGMGAFLSVSKGSDEEGKLIVMEYNNGKKNAKPFVLVGKGITFDTGGISIKPGAQMDEMKFDMCGAASVFGVISALIAMKAPVNVVGVIAAAENMPAGNASKPGDVVTTMSGQTVEILNTDAEGRLVLCDALTYVERFKPRTVIDVATLTGACVIALGNHATGLYANDDAFARTLIEAGEKALDRAWHMPLWDEYQSSLDSNFADMANIGGREAGSVTAACFLSRFAKKYTWAHMDIAGTAWNSGARKGATGRPVSLLLEYLLTQ